MDVALAVDVGGTKLAAGLVTADGRLLARRSVPTAAGDQVGAAAGGEALFARLIEVVDAVLADADRPPVVCGVGTGGPMTPGGEEVSPINIHAWRDFPLRRRLVDHLAMPTYVDNDAKALALAEGWVGGAAGEPNFVGMVVSTGVGGGIVLDGRLLGGDTGNAGHIGHIIVEPGGHRCGCGARGCLEAEASGTAIAAITGRPPAEAPPEVVARTGRLVGRAVASVVSLLDLRLAVVAGSVALGFGEPFFVAAQAELDECAQISFARGAVIRPAGLDDAGPLIGAAAVGWRGLGRDIGIR